VTARGQAVLDRIKLRSPIYGKCYRLSLLTRFCETLGLLIRSDVPVGDALYLTGQCSASATMRRTCARVQRAVEAGRKMSDAMSSERILGPMLTFMVSVGEKQEAPHEELHSAAEIFGSNLHNRARRAAYWVDAIVLVFVALLVILCSRLLFQPLIFLIRSMTGVE
jgi:type II secretory pathway component PulF